MAARTVLAVVVGALLGVVAARFVNRPIDTVISVVALLCYATPLFWIGLMFIVLFVGRARLAADQRHRVRRASPRAASTAWSISAGTCCHAGRHPGAVLYRVYTRLMRASMLETLGLDYVRTARPRALGDARRLRARAAQRASCRS